MITVLAAACGVTGGILLSLHKPIAAGSCALLAQLLDAVDGQVARLTGRVSAAGAFLDSTLDRYADGAMVMGSLIYLLTLRQGRIVPSWALFLIGACALIGSNAVSYSSARAENLGLSLGPYTRASKGTRMSVMIVCAFLATVWPQAPLIALFYLAVHPNLAVFWRIVLALSREESTQ